MEIAPHPVPQAYISRRVKLGDYEPGPAKTRRAPSWLHRDANLMAIYLYGMEDHEYTPPATNSVERSEL